MLLLVETQFLYKQVFGYKIFRVIFYLPAIVSGVAMVAVYRNFINLMIHIYYPYNIYFFIACFVLFVNFYKNNFKSVRVLPYLSNQNRQVARNSDFLFYLQALILVRVLCFSKSSFFSPTRTHISKNPYFTMLLSWDVNFLSQRLQMVIIVDFYNI